MGNAMLKQFALALSSLMLLALASAAPTQALDPKAPVYLPAGSVDVGTLIEPPPKLDSAKLREQMTVVLWLQRTRTPAQVAFVRKTLNLQRFAPLLSSVLVDVDGIELKKTFDDIISEVRADYDELKGKFDLPRPFQVNDTVQPVGDARPVAAYPSGHAIRATVYARLLGEIFPDQKEELIELAQQIGYGRVIAGVHFPIDVTAGQKLGHAYADVIVKQAAFKEAKKRIRGERQQPNR